MTVAAMTVGAPHEPEIEALAKAARGFLWVVRRVFALAGGLAFVWGIELVAGGTWLFVTRDTMLKPVMGFTCFSLGLPLVLPVDWTFGRGRWPLLVIASVLWFAPGAMQGDTEYGWILRAFATVVACASLLVWRTLWRLTQR